MKAMLNRDWQGKYNIMLGNGDIFHGNLGLEDVIKQGLGIFYFKIKHIFVRKIY